MPSDRSRRPTDARRSGSSSTTKTVEFASAITTTRDLKIGGMNFIQLASSVRAANNLVPSRGPEQHHCRQWTWAAYAKVYGKPAFRGTTFWCTLGKFACGPTTLLGTLV